MLRDESQVAIEIEPAFVSAGAWPASARLAATRRQGAGPSIAQSAAQPHDARTPGRQPCSQARWQIVDCALREIARRRAALDAEEARWLREAEALQIWRPLGMVSALDYLERVLGYAPRTAQDRLRVARALGALPVLTDALSAGRLPFSAIRELTRVATPATEAAWVAAATDKNLRQIEELVADRQPGDSPDDPPSPEARTHTVRFELSAEVFALLRQARTVLDDEHGTNLTDDAFVSALCASVLDAAPAVESSGRAKYQVAVSVCPRCRAGWQDGAGVQVAIDSAAVERAMCDAQHVGSLEGPAPERAHQDIAPSVARFVWRRDGGRCRVPGCRSARGLEIHHLVHRADGGSHDAANLILACSACHQAHHAGALMITGTPDRLVVHRPNVVRGVRGEHACAVDAHVGVGAKTTAEDDSACCAGAAPAVRRASKLDAAILHAQAKSALTALGWKPAIAQAAVAAAVADPDVEHTLERLLFEALRRCPVPKS